MTTASLPVDCPHKVRLVVFDWGGTTVDQGCFAPLVAFIECFASRGVELSADEARGPMGLHKKEHIRELLRLPEVAERWRRAAGSDWTDADVDALYRDFIPMQLASIEKHSELVDGLLPCCQQLRDRSIQIGTSTGFFREAAEIVFASGTEQGFVRDVDVCADDVCLARPAPFMVYRAMEATGVYPPCCVVKVGDTVFDIEEGLNAGAWSIGVVAASSDVGLSRAELDALAASERREIFQRHRERLLAAGAHQVIDCLSDLPAVIDEINKRLRQGAAVGRMESKQLATC